MGQSNQSTTWRNCPAAAFSCSPSFLSDSSALIHSQEKEDTREDKKTLDHAVARSTGRSCVRCDRTVGRQASGRGGRQRAVPRGRRTAGTGGTHDAKTRVNIIHQVREEAEACCIEPGTLVPRSKTQLPPCPRRPRLKGGAC